MTVCRLWAHNKLFVVIIIPNCIHNLYRNHEKFLKKECFTISDSGKTASYEKDAESSKDGSKGFTVAVSE